MANAFKFQQLQFVMQASLGLNRDILHDVTVMSDVLSRTSQHFDKLM